MRSYERALKLKPNHPKILEAVLYIIQYAQEHKYTFTQYSIVKSIFVADVNHLRKFGRPVTFDNYSAMRNGPVASETFNLVRPDGRHEFRNFGIDEPVWAVTPRPDIAPTAYIYHDVKRPVDLRKLSKTDRDELEQAADLVNKLGFLGTRDFTHENPAYRDAWRADSHQKSFPMNYKLLMPSSSEEDFFELVEASRHC